MTEEYWQLHNPHKYVGDKYWIWTNEDLRDLPFDCRLKLVNLAKDAVKLCIDNNGIHDPICKNMAEDVAEMEDYFLTKPEKLWEFDPYARGEI